VEAAVEVKPQTEFLVGQVAVAVARQIALFTLVGQVLQDKALMAVRGNTYLEHMRVAVAVVVLVVTAEILQEILVGLAALAQIGNP
jgi:hypothetical protein